MDEKARTRLDLHRDDVCSRAIYSLCFNLGAAMSNFKFKEGDLVEVIKCTTGGEGHRFVIGNFKVSNLAHPDGSLYMSHCNCYETDKRSNGKLLWSAESHLKLVNPDIDKISEFKFTELMDEITETITVEQ